MTVYFLLAAGRLALAAIYRANALSPIPCLRLALSSPSLCCSPPLPVPKVAPSSHILSRSAVSFIKFSFTRGRTKANIQADIVHVEANSVASD